MANRIVALSQDLEKPFGRSFHNRIRMASTSPLTQLSKLCCIYTGPALLSSIFAQHALSPEEK
jgi:hypothetical protein